MTRQKINYWNSSQMRKKASPISNCRLFRTLVAAWAMLMWTSRSRTPTIRLWRRTDRSLERAISILRKLRVAQANQRHRKVLRWQNWCQRTARLFSWRDCPILLKRMTSVTDLDVLVRLKAFALPSTGKPRNLKGSPTFSLSHTIVRSRRSSRWMARRSRADTLRSTTTARPPPKIVTKSIPITRITGSTIETQ